MSNTIRTILKIAVAIVGAVIFCSFNVSDAEDRLNIPALGFSMKNPEGWLIQPKQSFHTNLEKYEFDRESLQTLIKDHANSLPISTVTKYHPMNAEGVIPTINVIGRNNPLKDDETFLRSVNMSAHMLKRISFDFNMLVQPQFKDIDGVKSVYFSTEYKLKMTDGTMAPLRNQTYAIPNGDFVIQISLIDKPSDNCDMDFEQFVADLDITMMN